MNVPGTIKMSDVQGQRPAGEPAPQPINRILTVSYRGQEKRIGLVKLERTFVTIGRAPDNDIVVESPVASLYHATLQLRQDGCYIIDGQDRDQNGTFEPSTNGLYLNDGRPIRGEHLLESGDSVLIQSSTDQFNVTFTYYSKSETRLQPFPLGNKPVIKIGRLPNNDLVLPHLTVSGLHAELQRQPDGNYVLVHKSHTNDTLVNGQKVADRVMLMHTPPCQIQIGPFTLVYDGFILSPLDQLQDSKGKGPRVDAITVTKVVTTHPSLKEALTSLEKFGQLFTGKKKTLLNKVTLPIQPGDFVAVVGGSGTGKSTLLKSMIGILDTEKGSQVLIDGEDLFLHFDRYRGTIGYVPQDDIIHTDLTCAQVLYYVVRLRGLHIKPAQRGAHIDDLLDQVQLTKQKDTVVGQLSGGQRKRLSIAVELAADPSILVLDEPTSGLDPGLDQIMMKLLAKLSREGNKTIILVTHATENVEMCTKVAFMAEGGVLTFYGRPAEAKQFFGVEKFATIYLMLNSKEKDNLNLKNKDQNWAETYQQSPFFSQYVDGPMQTLHAHSTHPGVAGQTANKPHPRSGLSVFFQQTGVLAMRYVQANLFPLLILLALPVLLALLFFLVADQNLFTALKPTLKDLANIQIDRNAQNKFFTNIQSIQQVIFMLSTVSVFVGLLGSYQEIVKERGIYDRERLVNLNIAAYVVSKALVLAVLAFLQSLLLVLVIDAWVKVSGDGLTDMGPRWEMVISIFLVTLASVAFGLLVSALVNRKREQTTIVIILLITIQIIFSGAIFTLKGDSEWLTYMTLTRWGTEAIGSAIGLHTISAISPWIKAIVDGLPMVFGDQGFMFQRWAVLVAYITVLTVLTGVTLYLQDTVRKRQQQKRK